MDWPERIDTDRLRLRVPTAHDATAIFEDYAQDREVVRYLMWRAHQSIGDTEAFLETRQRGWEVGDDLAWVLTIKGHDRVIGMVGIRLRGFKPDIGYVLARAYWGKGLMAEVARAVVDLAFTDPGIHRVWAVCDVDNRASARVMEKVGMTFEGVLRRWVLHPNVSAEPRDAICYARIRP